MEQLCVAKLRRQTAGNGRAVQVAYAFQDFSSLPQFYTLPPERVKPFGTVHALLCAEDVVQEPFCVINADDYYGGGAYRTMYKALDRLPATGKAVMVGYHLKNTASLYGTVSRGVCEAAEGTLRSIRETKQIQLYADGSLRDLATGQALAPDTLVSMNFWGFTPHFLDVIWDRFPAFLDGGLRENPMKCEFYLPSVVNSELQDGRATVCLLPCDEVWHGVTYKEDLESVVSALAALHREGLYPPRLWE